MFLSGYAFKRIGRDGNTVMMKRKNSFIRNGLLYNLYIYTGKFWRNMCKKVENQKNSARGWNKCYNKS